MCVGHQIIKGMRTKIYFCCKCFVFFVKYCIITVYVFTPLKSHQLKQSDREKNHSSVELPKIILTKSHN